MKTLVYLSYGQGGHVGETIFSILSALHRAGPGPRDFDIVVYTDDDRPFIGLPVRFEPLSETRLRDWTGPHGYKHRRKIMTVMDALERYRGRVVFVDSDTWFKRSPSTLFGRIAPGRSCLHLLEGRLASVRDGHGYGELAAFLAGRELLGPDDRALEIPIDPPMWNSGIIGMDSSDARILPEVVGIIDQIWSRFQGVHTIEQFALGHVLERRTRIRTSDDVVFHYWMDVLRAPFQAVLPSILPELRNLNSVEQVRRVYAHRPRPRLRRRCKLAVVHRFQDVGLFHHRMRASG